MERTPTSIDDRPVRRAGYFALETHHHEIAEAIRDFLTRRLTLAAR